MKCDNINLCKIKKNKNKNTFISEKKCNIVITFNNNNNNNKVYTPLSEKCSQSRVFISQCHIIHIVQYYAYWLVWFM